LHIPKIQFLFPVSFTIEYKVGIPEFYLYMGCGADLLNKISIRWQDSAPPISGYWPTSEPNAG